MYKRQGYDTKFWEDGNAIGVDGPKSIGNKLDVYKRQGVGVVEIV